MESRESDDKFYRVGRASRDAFAVDPLTAVEAHFSALRLALCDKGAMTYADDNPLLLTLLDAESQARAALENVLTES